MKTNMELEIFSQTDVINAIEKKYVIKDKIVFEGLDKNFEEIKFIASGSSYNAARLAHKFFEQNTSMRVSFEYASEFISNRGKKFKSDTLYCFVSQSGETFDTKCALELVKNKGIKTLAVVNNINSSIYNLADYKIDMLAGVENSIAATKSFLAGVIVLWLLSLYFGDNPISPLNMLKEAREATKNAILSKDKIDEIAKIISRKKKLSIIGYNFGYILAKELALKIKETSYIDTTAYPTGEFLHGHTAILNKNKTLIEIFTSNMSLFEENTLNKIKADFKPQIIAITDTNFSKNAINFPLYEFEISKICAITVILQFLALKVALYLNYDVDKPKGLKKVVR